MDKRKRILSILLCVVMLTMLLPTAAFAEGTAPANTPQTEVVEQAQENVTESATEDDTPVATLEEDETEQTAYDKAVTLFVALPDASAITAETTDEEKENFYNQLGEAMAAYDALSEDEQAKFEEEHADLLSGAMALNDAITGNTAVTLATPVTVSTQTELQNAIYTTFSTTTSAEDPLVITVAPEGITLTSSLYIFNYIKITGGTIKRGDACTSEMINMQANANLTLENITIDGGAVWSGNDASGTNSGLAAEKPIIEMPASSNVVVEIATGAVLQNNHNTGFCGGGAVYVGDGDNLILSGGTIRNNRNDSSAYGGGAVYLDYNFSAPSVFTMKSGVISGNAAPSGGGVFMIGPDSVFNMMGGEISGNVSTSDGYSFSGGGGVYANGKFTMTAGSITGNRSSGTVESYPIPGYYKDEGRGNGAGVLVGQNGTFTISGSSTITGNTRSGTVNNLTLDYLSEGTHINIAGKLTGTIGVSLLDHVQEELRNRGFSCDYPVQGGTPVMIAEGSDYTITSEDLACVTADLTDRRIGYVVIQDGNKLKIAAPKKTEVSFSDINIVSREYNGEPIAYTGTLAATDENSAPVTLPESDLVLTWYEPNAGIDFILKEAPTAAGTYKLVVSVSEDSKDFTGSTTINFTISQKEIELEWNNTEFTYDGYSHKPTATVKNLLPDDSCKITVSGEKTDASASAYTATAASVDNSNYKLPATNTTTFVIKNAGQTAPAVSAENETIFGKADGKITDVTAAMEYKKQGDATYTAITGTGITNLSAGTYLVRYAAKTNYNASPDATVTIEAGRKLTVSIPDTQTGYTLTSSASEVGWNGTVTLTFAVNDGYTFTGNKEVTATNGTIVDNGNGSYTVKDIQANTVISVNEVKDITAPIGEIKVSTNSWKEFVSSVTFGLFFKGTQDVSITATDAGSGVDKIYYYISETAMTEENVKAVTAWTEFGSLSLEPNKNYVVYVKLTDKSGNTAYISSDGMVFDNIAPSITGFTEDGVYCTEQTVTVTDTNLDKITLDNVSVTLENGAFTVTPGAKAQIIIATDKAGNSTTMSFPVLKHTKGEWVVDKYATTEEKGHRHIDCTVCGTLLQEEDIPKLDDPNAGLVKKDTVVGAGAPETTFNNDVKTLREQLLKEDENKRVAGGENARIYLEITNIDSTVSAEDKALIEKEAKDEFGVETTLTYIDISLFKQIGNDAAQKITNPNCPISVTIIIPENIRADGRVFKIVRVHNGTSEIITGQYDAATGAFTFETNQFSTYAIAYHDHSYGAWLDTKDGSHHKKVCSCGDEITEEHKWDAGKVTTEATTDKEGVKNYTCSECGATKTESIPKKSTSPQTGDNSNMALWIALLFISGGAVTVLGVSKKRKYTSKH